MAKVKVRAKADFRNATIGSRSKGEEFTYDAEGDAEKLVALELVEKVSAKAETKA